MTKTWHAERNEASANNDPGLEDLYHNCSD